MLSSDRFSWKILTCLLLLGAVAQTATAEEQRCAEIGRNCICSETLDVVQSLPPERFINPINSTTKECSAHQSGNSVFLRRGGTTPTSAFMPGDSAVQRVWAYEGHGVANVRGNPSSITSSTRRECFRSYQRFSSDFSLTVVGPTCEPGHRAYPDCCERNKGMDINAPFGHIQMEEHDFGFVITWIVRNASGQAIRSLNLAHSGPRLKITDCQTSWCSFEVCIAGDLARGRNVYAEGRVVQLSTGRSTYYFDPDGPVPQTVGGTDHTRMFLLNLFRQFNSNIPGENHACRGTRYFSHVMQAQWDNDDGQWIGPAYEIEGSDNPVELGPPGRPYLIR